MIDDPARRDWGDRLPTTDPADPSRRPAYNDLRDDYDDEYGRRRTPAERARLKLQWPAVAFVVIGVIGILGGVVGTVAILATQCSGAMVSDERLVIMIVCVCLTVLGTALFAVVLIAGINMLRQQHRGLALIAAYFVAGLSIAGIYAILFFPFGIWALIVLHQPDVRALFDRRVSMKDVHA